jgi:hypothetical protein
MIRRGFFEENNPITELDKKDKNFVWTDKCTKEFSKDLGFVDVKTLNLSRHTYLALVPLTC